MSQVGIGVNPLLCTCPEATFSGPAPDWQACRDRAPMGLDPHPVLSAEDLQAMTAVLIEKR